MHSHSSPLNGLVSLLMSSRKDSLGPYPVVSLNFVFVDKMETVMEREKSVNVIECRVYKPGVPNGPASLQNSAQQAAQRQHTPGLAQIHNDRPRPRSGPRPAPLARRSGRSPDLLHLARPQGRGFRLVRRGPIPDHGLGLLLCIWASPGVCCRCTACWAEFCREAGPLGSPSL